MIITKVLGSGGCEQERSGSTHTSKNPVTIVILSEAKDLLFVRAASAALGI
jgi:hypothetical protein